MIILQLPIGYGSFNPRSRMGSDTVKGDDFGAWLEFQSTLPHGERPDLIVYDYLTGEVSIHAPAWGATGFDRMGGNSGYVSIHAPAWGATVRSIFFFIPHILFQSTLPHGERLNSIQEPDRLQEVSIHAPAWGAT